MENIQCATYHYMDIHIYTHGQYTGKMYFAILQYNINILRHTQQVGHTSVCLATHPCKLCPGGGHLVHPQHEGWHAARAVAPHKIGAERGVVLAGRGEHLHHDEVGPRREQHLLQVGLPAGAFLTEAETSLSSPGVG